jgi:hypothetical protein
VAVRVGRSVVVVVVQVVLEHLQEQLVVVAVQKHHLLYKWEQHIQ